MGCLVSIKKGSLAEQDYKPEKDAETLNRALNGPFPDEGAIIDVIANRSIAQRQQIKEKFKDIQIKGLMEELNVKLTGCFLESCVALFQTLTQRDARRLQAALAGVGTNDSVLIEIMCTRTNTAIADIKALYQSEFGHTLEQDIKDDTSGDFEKFLVSLCQGSRDEDSEVDADRACEDAKKLYVAGEKKWGTDESVFIEILTKRSFLQLKITFEEYNKICKHSILESLDREMSGDLLTGLKTIVRYLQSPGELFAEKIHDCLKDEDYKTLIQIVVSRLEIDLEDIKSAFLLIYQQSLHDFVLGDGAEVYRQLLAAVTKAK